MKIYNIDYFSKKDYSFALIKNNKIIFKSKGQGLKPLVFCLRKYRREMRGAIVFDKIVGLAAAKLLVYGGVAEILTPTISVDAKKYLLKNKVKIVFEKEVKNIMDNTRTDLCLMEKSCRKKAQREFLRDLNVY